MIGILQADPMPAEVLKHYLERYEQAQMRRAQADLERRIRELRRLAGLPDDPVGGESRRGIEP